MAMSLGRALWLAYCEKAEAAGKKLDASDCDNLRQIAHDVAEEFADADRRSIDRAISYRSLHGYRNWVEMLKFARYGGFDVARKLIAAA